MAIGGPPMAIGGGKLANVEAFPPVGGPPVATVKTVTATEVATDVTVLEDRWPPMDFPGLSTREYFRKLLFSVHSPYG